MTIQFQESIEILKILGLIDNTLCQMLKFHLHKINMRKEKIS